VPHERFQRQQVNVAAKTLRRMRTTDDLAQEVGAQLGPGEVLQRTLPLRISQEIFMNLPTPLPRPLRRLVLVLGDQLWLGNPALADFDPTQDAVLMIEAPGEASHVWSHKARIVLFLSAMRHFRQTLVRKGFPLR
jgi:hypothetical protein